MFERLSASAESRPVAARSAKAPHDPTKGLVGRYRSFCYHLFGERLDSGKALSDLADRLKQAGINDTPGMHRALQLLTTILATVVASALAIILFGLVIHGPLWYAYAGLFILIAAGATAGSFGMYVGTRISNRRQELERELPFTLSELSVLASTGMSPIELVHRMARRTHDPTMTTEFKKIVYKTDIQGKDLISALAETAKESPSIALRESLWDIANMIHQGGNLDEYFRNKSDDVLKLKRLVQKEFIERLQSFVDMYISLVLIGVLMIAVGAFLLNSFGSTAAGLSANQLLLVLTYGIVPMAVVLTAVLITMAYAKAT